MPYLGIDSRLVAPQGLSITGGGSLTIAWPPVFSVIRRSGGHWTAGTVANVCPVIPLHA